MHPWLLQLSRVEGPYEVTDTVPLHTDVWIQDVIPTCICMYRDTQQLGEVHAGLIKG